MKRTPANAAEARVRERRAERSGLALAHARGQAPASRDLARVGAHDERIVGQNDEHERVERERVRAREHEQPRELG